MSRTRGLLASEFLDAAAISNLGRIDVAFRVDGDVVNPFEVAGHVPWPPETSEFRAAFTVDDHHLHIGTVCDEQERIDEAMAAYRKAPNVADAHYNLARLHEIRGDQLAALRHFRRFQILERERR